MQGKLRVVALGVLSLAVATGTAHATTVIGDPSQSQSQNTAASQGLTQSGSTAIPFGGSTTRTGTNTSATTAANAETIAQTQGVDVVVGNPSQSAQQNATTSQDLTGVRVGSNTGTTLLLNAQNVLGVGADVIVGRARQSNAQNSATNQNATVSSGGAFSTGGTRTLANLGSTNATNCQAVDGAVPCLII